MEDAITAAAPGSDDPASALDSRDLLGSAPASSPGSGSIRIRVATAARETQPYDIVIGSGILDVSAAAVPAAAPAAAYAVIADDNVSRLYGHMVLSRLRTAADLVELFQFESGETHKTRETWAALTDAMLKAGFGRDSCVVALGGGVTGDLAGFVAATYMRGLPLVQMPTTLLAMIDASIGGKTGVDTPAGKNLVGAFLQPRLVLADPLVLRSLPDDELRAGLAEAVKHGATADAFYLDEITAAAPALLDRDATALARLVLRSVEIKAGIISRDPRDRGERARLNFGHTIGHALERASGYTLRHGPAVAIGMVAEAAIGEQVGVTQPGTAVLLRELLQALGLPHAMPPAIAIDDVMAAAATDKKVRARRLRFSLVERAGVSARTHGGDWTHPADDAAIRAALARVAHR